jgi:RNA recognition motif-containing protein
MGAQEGNMSTNIYVGNLSFNVTVEEIQDLFGAYGTVENVNLITDRETGRLRGFGFVEMASGGNEAIAALDEKDFGGRNLTVNRAKPREQRERQPHRW